jgi:hypothetical protein
MSVQRRRLGILVTGLTGALRPAAHGLMRQQNGPIRHHGSGPGPA